MESSEAQRIDQAREDLFMLLISDGETVREALRLVVHYFPEAQ